jgi:hypothetical protein
VVFARINPEQVRKLAAAARSFYPVVSSDEVSQALDPDTMQPTALPPGLYLAINGQYCGLDHSGTDVDAVNSEIWAIIFTQYCAKNALSDSLLRIVEHIIDDLATPVSPA